MTIERLDESALPERLRDAIKTATALFLDKPPAGAAENFGAAGMRHFAKCLTEPKGPKSWAKMFEPGPRLSQALAGTHGQPGVWDWIETWGTAPGADRGTYADFLREAAVWIGQSDLAKPAEEFERSKHLWQRLAEEALPNELAEFARLKELKRHHHDLWFIQGREAEGERAQIRDELKELVSTLEDPARLAPLAAETQARMAQTVLEIVAVEEAAMQSLRNMLL
jgi:hypothetical protein